MNKKEKTQEEIDKENMERIKKAKEQYERFLKYFEKGKCYYCSKDLNSLDKDNPCLHWLLYPPGLKKKYFDIFFKKFDLFQINTYLMHVAFQEENSYANINNLSIERDSNKFWEVTIKYKNLKWSFSCSQTDFMGHENSRVNFPHYHFLMQINRKPFISFDDYHIPLTEDDRLRIMAHNNPMGNFVHLWYIPGMEEIFNQKPKDLMKWMKTTEDEKNAPFNLSGIFELDGGISGEDIYKAMMKSKNSGESLIKCLSEIPNIKMKTIIEPGEAVPKLDRKLSRGKKKNGKKE
jgi:hypothetical protein